MSTKSSKSSGKSAYKRILIKLSGESLAGSKEHICPETSRKIARRIQEIVNLGVQVSIVIGGGNIWRGLTPGHESMDRSTADYMGMLATVINALALQEALESIGVNTRVQTAIEMKNVAEPFIRRRAIRHLEKGRVVIFGAGTGNPYFSTHTCAALRANEICAEVLIKATKVDGIYDKDPKKFKDAKRYNQISYRDALTKRIQVMDSTSFSLCMDNKMPIIVLDMFQDGQLKDAVLGKKVGTIVSE